MTLRELIKLVSYDNVLSFINNVVGQKRFLQVWVYLVELWDKTFYHYDEHPFDTKIIDVATGIQIGVRHGGSLLSEYEDDISKASGRKVRFEVIKLRRIRPWRASFAAFLVFSFAVSIYLSCTGWESDFRVKALPNGNFKVEYFNKHYGKVKPPHDFDELESEEFLESKWNENDAWEVGFRGVPQPDESYNVELFRTHLGKDLPPHKTWNMTNDDFLQSEWNDGWDEYHISDQVFNEYGEPMQRFEFRRKLYGKEQPPYKVEFMTPMAAMEFRHGKEKVMKIFRDNPKVQWAPRHQARHLMGHCLTYDTKTGEVIEVDMSKENPWAERIEKVRSGTVYVPLRVVDPPNQKRD